MRNYSWSRVILSVLLVLPHISLGDLIVAGAPGIPGDKGDPGPQGVAGLPGLTGDQGPVGVSGDKGEKGQKGDVGIAGQTGIPGPAGDKGSQNTAGATGATGLPGANGQAGPSGGTGEMGATGERGVKGPTGEQGSIGPAAGGGLKGEQGPTGPQGEKGNKGRVGFRGSKGIRGLPGAQGAVYIDECAANDTCPTEAVGCDNNPLGHTCRCPSGYIYNKGGNSCDDVDECSVKWGNCDHLCENSIGSYFCSCTRDGFELSPQDKHSCIDINECENPTQCEESGKEMVCINTYGSYVCVDMTPIADISLDASGQVSVEGTGLVSESMVIVLVVWACFLTLLFIVIVIILIIKRQNYITEHKSIAKAIR